MRNDKTEIKEHIVIEEVLISKHLYCDFCKSEIQNKNQYFHLMIGHNDWGYESCESYEHKDICSNECLQAEFDNYLKDTSRSSFFNVERSCWDNWIKKGEKPEKDDD